MRRTSDFTDFDGIEQLLDDAGRDAVRRTGEFMTKEVEPVINHYWTREEFPFELAAGIAGLGIAGVAYEGYGCPGGGPLLDGVLAMQLARSDPSMSTFMGVHSGLAMGSIYLCGSEEQKQRWLPEMARMDKIGAFGLTEPEVGSGVAGGLRTTARREGDWWALDGQKKWIGNATFADYIIIWARDVSEGATGRSRGSSWRRGRRACRPPRSATRSRCGWCRTRTSRSRGSAFLSPARSAAGRLVPPDRRGAAADPGGGGLAGGRLRHGRLRARARLRQGTRAVRPADRGLPAGAGPAGADAREHHGLGLHVRQARPALQAAGQARDEHSALAKAFCTVRMRETVGYARELLGGNGILLDHQVGRFVADAEAIYSYEGTREINTLVVGRAITGLSAFV